MNYLGYAISGASGGGGGGSSFDPLFIDSSLVPTDTETYDVGRTLKRWRNGEFTTVNATTGNVTTVNATTGNVTTVNATMGNVTNINCATIGGVSALAPVDVLATNGLTANRYTVNGANNTQYQMGDGSLLQASANAGNSNFYLYNSKFAIGSSPIGNGKIGYSPTQAGATFLYISSVTSDAVNVSVYWSNITTLNDVYVQDAALATNFIRYNITGPPVPSALSDTLVIPVTVSSSGGTGTSGFEDNLPVMVAFFMNLSEADQRISTLETKTFNQTSAGTVTTFNGSLNVPTIDTTLPTILAIGTTTQTQLNLGRVGVPTNLRGSLITCTGTFIPNTNNTYNLGSSSLPWNTIYGTILNSNTIDTLTPVALSIGTGTQTTLNLGRSVVPMTLQGSTITTTGSIVPSLTQTYTIGSNSLLYSTIFGAVIGTNLIDVPVPGTNITIGITSANSITIGRTGQTVSFPGSVANSLTIATSVLSPAFNTATATAMAVGNVNQTGLTLGRNTTANTLIQGLAILTQNVPFISTVITAPTAAQSRLSLSKFFIPVNATTTTGTLILTAIAGSMGSVNTVANEHIVGSCWRYRFNGVVVNAAATNSLSFQITHAGGTQNIITWTYAATTLSGSNFNAEIILNWTAIGASSTLQASGHVNYVNGASVSISNIGVSTFSPVYNTTVANTNANQIVASPATLFQYSITNFTVEHLR